MDRSENFSFFQQKKIQLINSSQKFYHITQKIKKNSIEINNDLLLINDIITGI